MTIQTQTMPTNELVNSNEKLQMHEYFALFEDSQFEMLKEYAQEGMLEEDWLWQLTAACIQSNNYEGMKKLHEVFGYDWKTPIKYQTLLPLASSYARNDDTRIFEYMLETGADLRELDYSEDWDMWEFEVKDIIEDDEGKWYGVECIDLIKWTICQGDNPNVLYDIMNRYV